MLGTQPIENIAQNALAGVFGYIGSAGHVTELKLENTSITSNADVGVLTGRNEGSISACVTSGASVTSSKSDAFVSEFAADNENRIESVYSSNFSITNMLGEDAVTPILLNYAPGYSSTTGNGSASAAFTERKESVENSLFVTEAPAGVTVLDTSQFADGAAAWSLNSGFTDPKFSQLMGTDQMPVLIKRQTRVTHVSISGHLIMQMKQERILLSIQMVLCQTAFLQMDVSGRWQDQMAH